MVVYIPDDEDNVNISGPVVFEQYIVIADYKKKNKNDISLSAGDTVDVIERNNYGKQNASMTMHPYNINVSITGQISRLVVEYKLGKLPDASF